MFYKISVNILCIVTLTFGAVNYLNAVEQTQDKALMQNYDMQEIMESGDKFFGNMSGGLAKVFTKIFASYGKPNAYILGFETSGSIVGGITYGKGTLYNKSGKLAPVFWTGPSVGIDFGGQASRLMILVYNLNNIEEMWRRYAGISGSAYAVAGAGFNVLQNDNILLRPVKAGIGARLGVNMGYLKFRPHPTVNPF